MALTVSTTPAATTFPSILGSSTMDVVSIVSNVSLTGDSIYVRVGMFESLTTTLTAPTAVPTEGWSAVYPGASTIDMDLINGPNSQYNSLQRVQLTVVDSLNFSITIDALMSMDVNGFLNNGILDSNLDRPLKNSIDNAIQQNNDFGSVYNGNRVMVVEVFTDDGAGGTAGAVYSKQINARWYNKGLNNGSPEFDTFQYVPTRGGFLVPNFSPFGDTNIKFYLNHTAGVPSNTYAVAIFRTDNVNNNAIYGTDLEVNYGINPGPTAFSNLPTTAIAAMNNPVLTSVANRYCYEVDFDADYFTPGGMYRVALIVQDGGGTYQNSFLTLPIPASQPTDGSFGTITTEIETYDFNSTTAVTDCAAGLTPRERVQVKASMDKADYDSEIRKNGSFGNFDFNFKEATVFTLSSMPVDGFPITITPESLVRFEITDTSTDHEIRTEFRIPDDWAGTTKYVVFKWLFEVGQGTQNAYNDEIYQVVALTVRDFDTTILTGITIEDDAMTVLDPDAICDDVSGDLTFNIATSAGTPADYSFFPLVKKNITGLNWSEEDGYNNTLLTRLFAALITSTDTDLSGGTFTIPANELEVGQEYCVTVVAKKKVTAASGACPAITLDVTQETKDVVQTPSYFIYRVHVELSYIITGVSASDIEEVLIAKIGNNPYNGTVLDIAIGTFTGLTGLGTFIHDAPGPAICNYTAIITLTDGCVYETSFTLETNEIITNTDNLSIPL